MFDNILVVLFGKEDCTNAMGYAMHLAKKSEAKIKLLSIVSPNELKVAIPGPHGVFTTVFAEKAKIVTKKVEELKEYLEGLKEVCEKDGVSSCYSIAIAPFTDQLSYEASLMDIMVKERFVQGISKKPLPKTRWVRIVRKSLCPVMLIPSVLNKLESVTLVHDESLKSYNKMRTAYKIASLLEVPTTIFQTRRLGGRGLIKFPPVSALFSKNTFGERVVVKNIENKSQLPDNPQSLIVLSTRELSFFKKDSIALRKRIKRASCPVLIVP